MAFLSRRRALTTPAISLIVLLSLLFWVDDALPYFDVSEISYGRFWDRSGWLLTHVIGGSLALLVGPFQFWSGLRQRHMQFHQWTGRLYTVGVALSAATALAAHRHSSRMDDSQLHLHVFFCQLPPASRNFMDRKSRNRR